MATAFSVILVTAASDEEAGRIAHELVSQRLAACVNILGPIRSVYSWRDQVHDESERLLIVKTRAELVPEVEARVRALHSYETPEVIALPIASGSEPYLDWIWAETRGAGK